MLNIEGCVSIMMEEDRLLLLIQDGGDLNHPTILEITIPKEWKEHNLGYCGGKDGDGVPVLISHGGLEGTLFDIHNYGKEEEDECV